MQRTSFRTDFGRSSGSCKRVRSLTLSIIFFYCAKRRLLIVICRQLHSSTALLPLPNLQNILIFYRAVNLMIDSSIPDVPKNRFLLYDWTIHEGYPYDWTIHEGYPYDWTIHEGYPYDWQTADMFGW